MNQSAKKLATVDDLLAMPDHLRIELIDGEIVEKASPSFEHSSAQASLSAALVPKFGRGDGQPGGWWIGTEVDTEYESHQLYRHDLAGWRKSRVPEKPAGRPTRIRPDWVCEILSPSNWKNDTVSKFRVLHKHAVPHYWLVDVEHQELTVYRWSNDGYVVSARVGPGDKTALEPFETVEFDVSMLLGIDAAPSS